MKKQLIIVAMIFLLAIPGISMSGSFHFGIISSVKDKVEEIKEEKEKDKLPKGVITSPVDGSTVSGIVDVLVAVNIFVPKVEFYVDGILKSTNTVEPYSYSLDTTQYTEGVHTIEAKAYNTENKSSNCQSDVTVDNDSSPAISITSLYGNPILSGAVDMTSEVSDDKGVIKVEFSIDGSLVSTDISTPYSYNWNTVSYINGSHTVDAKAYDTVNQTTSVQYTVTVNNVSNDNPPTISITSPADGSEVSGALDITAAASDNNGISKVEFYINGILKDSDTTSPYGCTWNTVQYSTGTYTIKVTAYDTVNQTTNDQHSVIVVDNPPTITITTPTDNSTVFGTVGVETTTNDDKGISKVEFYIDNVLESTVVTSPYSYSWDTVQYSTGTHTIKATVYDTVNQTTNDQHSVTVKKWNMTTVDSTGDVGWPSSIALDSNNNPHIAYFDETNDDLKYAKWTGSAWNITTLDSTGAVGSYASLALDSSNNPQIAYHDETNGDLKYAKWTGSAWNITTVDSTGAVGENASLALDRSNNPHIAYYDSTNKDLKYAKWTGSSWNITTVDSTGDVGMYSSLTLDSSNNPHIAYYDGTNKDLKYAKWTGSAWNVTTVDSTGDVGWYSSLALDSSNNIYIAYYDSTNYKLKYARWTGSSWSITTITTVDSLGEWYASLSLVLDNSNNPHIAYFDIPNWELKYAWWIGSAWNIYTVDLGGYASLALDSSNIPQIAYYDGSNKDLKYATLR